MRESTVTEKYIHARDQTEQPFRSRSHATKWVAFIPNAHPGYISLEQFEENERSLQEGSQAHGCDRRKILPEKDQHSFKESYCADSAATE